MRRFDTILILALAAMVSVGRSQDATPPTVPPVPDLPLGELRDPFWPVGWVPPKMERVTFKSPALPQQPVRWEEVARKLEVSALSQLPDGRHIAVLKNIGLVEAGDTISVNYGGLTYRWEVRAVTAAGIQTKRVGVSAQRGK